MTTPRQFDRSLAVLTHVPHWSRDGAPPLAYEPYVRELEVWARLFARVEVLAPRAEGPPRGNLAAYAAPNIRWRPVHYSMSTRPGAQLLRLAQLPQLLWATLRLARQADVVHLRSPGHPALFGRPIALALGRPTITKWAGMFGAVTGERLPSKVERWLMVRLPGTNLIYGPASGSNLVSFIPALMSEAELARASALAVGRQWRAPWRILSVGRLSPVKGFDLALRGLARLRRLAPDLPWSFTLVGDGVEADALRELARSSGIADRVTFTGALPFAAVQELFGHAHVVIMPGATEGWPKPVSEAWAHGAVPVAANGGILPWLLDGRDAGRLFAPEPDALAQALAGLLSDPAALPAMGRRGQELCAELSLEVFGSRLHQILIERCGMPA